MSEPTDQERAMFGKNDAQLRHTGMSDDQIAALRKKQWSEGDDQAADAAPTPRTRRTGGDASA